MNVVIRKVISGGQTGADRGALDAALELGVPCGGWCPRGRRAEDRAVPSKYPMQETASVAYAVKTRLNVEESDLTLIFTLGPLTPGSRLTLQYARAHKVVVSHFDLRQRSEDLVAELIGIALVDAACAPKDEGKPVLESVVVNVAGSRESKAPGLHAAVYRIMRQVLRANVLL